ncbi:MAG TPA: tripartite tricarboxylate transporter substrate-binding protein [Burkholderiales bacterium]
MRALARLLCLVLACAAALPAFAQDAASFPNRTVRIIVGFPPGGSSDVTARIVAERMSEEWKQPVIVENKPGAASTIAAAYVAASPADGYTILHLGPGTHAISSFTYKGLAYDPVKSFAGIGNIAFSPFVVVVPVDSPFKSLREIIDAAKAKPGQVSYASSGSGGGPNLVTEVIASSAGVKFLHVPYKGTGPAAAAAVAGQVNFATVDSASAIPYVKGGKLRALAVTTEKRSVLFKDVPSVAEAAVPGFAYPSAVGLAAPAGTPREVVLKINAALNRALAQAPVRERLEALGFEAAPMSPDEFQAFLAGEVAKYGKVVRDLGLKVD